MYLQTFLDTYTKLAFAKLYESQDAAGCGRPAQ